MIPIISRKNKYKLFVGNCKKNKNKQKENFEFCFVANFIVTSPKSDTILLLPATIGDLAKVEKYSVNEVYDEIIKYVKKKTGLDFYARHKQGSYQFTIELDYESLIAKL
jgi:hypothetical protein